MPIDAVYLAFFAAAFGAFRALPVRPALLLVCLGGWMLLPVGTYPPTEGATFPWWISGLALPSDMLVTKAWVAPVTALLWGVVFDPGALGRWRPAGSRPWGLAMLLAGQYGLVGVGLAFGTLAAVAFRTAVRRHGRPVWTTGGAALPLALIVVLALGDGVLNAFLYFPAMLAAGAIAGGTRPAAPPRATHVHRA